MELLLYRFENIRNTFSYENSTKIDTFFFLHDACSLNRIFLENEKAC